MKFVAPLQHRSMFRDKCIRPLFLLKLGAFFDPHLGLFGRAAKRREDRDVAVEPNAVIPPMPGSDHSPIKVKYALQFDAVESGNRSPVPRVRKRRDHAQALFTIGLGWLRALNSATSRRSAAMSFSSSMRRALPGSQSSPHGVP